MATSYCFQHFPHYEFADPTPTLLASDLLGIKFAYGDELMLGVKGVVLLAVARTSFIVKQVIEFTVGSNVVGNFMFSFNYRFVQPRRHHRLQYLPESQRVDLQLYIRENARIILIRLLLANNPCCAGDMCSFSFCAYIPGRFRRRTGG